MKRERLQTDVLKWTKYLLIVLLLLLVGQVVLFYGQCGTYWRHCSDRFVWLLYRPICFTLLLSVLFALDCRGHLPRLCCS